jgi:oligoribonuclease
MANHLLGLDPEKDVLLEIAVLVTDSQLEIVAEGPDIVIHQADSVLDSMGEWCRETHGRSGLTKAVRSSTINAASCQSIVLDFLRQHTPVGKCPLAGNSVGQDARFLNRYMPDLMAHLHYRIIDVSSVKELARRWYPDVVARAPPKSATHRALDDIKESIAELKFYRQSVFK